MTAHFHHVPGRLRVHMPRIKGSVTDARALEARLSAIKGVSGVEGRELTGSVVVYYNPNKIDLQALTLMLGLGHSAMPMLDAEAGHNLCLQKFPKRLPER